MTAVVELVAVVSSFISGAALGVVAAAVAVLGFFGGRPGVFFFGVAVVVAGVEEVGVAGVVEALVAASLLLSLSPSVVAEALRFRGVLGLVVAALLGVVDGVAVAVAG